MPVLRQAVPADASLIDPEVHVESFRQAREARRLELVEDYVELIADLHASTGEARAAEIARRLGVSHVTVVRSITRLEREGLAVTRPYRGVALTEAGLALAERVRARHRLVVATLVALGVPSEVAEQDAEGIEHHVSDSCLLAFARFLGAEKR